MVIDFDLWKYATDIGYSLHGLFEQETRGDFLGEVFHTTIAGPHPSGLLFRAEKR